jgi:hypothetical protein
MSKSKKLKNKAPVIVPDTKASAKAAAPAAAPSTPAPKLPGQILPLFYRSIEILNHATHGTLRYHPVQDYGFAAKANAIPLTATELSDAAPHYPIVFAGSGTHIEPVAVVGHKQGHNPFVDDLGYWRKGSYIPAYVRRFPFNMAQDGAGNVYLAADTMAEAFSDEEQAEPLYVSGKPSDVAKRALQFCLAYSRAQQSTSVLCRAIEEAGILVERVAEVRMPGGTNKIRGFRIVNETALNQLPDEQWLKLRQSGVLPLIYTHLMSMNAWKNILQ